MAVIQGPAAQCQPFRLGVRRRWFFLGIFDVGFAAAAAAAAGGGAGAAESLHLQGRAIDESVETVDERFRLRREFLGETLERTFGRPLLLRVVREKTILDPLPKDGDHQRIYEEGDVRAEGEKENLVNVRRWAVSNGLCFVTPIK